MSLVQKIITRLKLVTLKLPRVKLKVLVAIFIFVIIFMFGGKMRNERQPPPASPVRLPRELRAFVRYPAGFQLPPRDLPPKELSQLAVTVERLNNDAEIFNWETYGPFVSDTNVIVIQVHKNVERLQYLIVSLAQVQRIQKVLLIFSHSYYDEHINRLVRTITFTKVMQIFYPYSLQLNPNKFPGRDPDDCPGVQGAVRGCHDRDARLTEHKQHWWWKANYIFHGFEWSETYKGLVVFLEENDYVLPDMLYMLTYGQNSFASFPSVEVISFGRPYKKNLKYDTFTIDTWQPPYDRGLTFNRTTWLKFQAQSPHFCFYNDFSWSYSLVHLCEKLPRGFVEMAATSAPRVLRQTSTGGAAVGAAELALVFPQAVFAVLVFAPTGHARHRWRPPPQGNGGWADLRDQMLCLDTLLSDTSSEAGAPTPPLTIEVAYFESDTIKTNKSVADV